MKWNWLSNTEIDKQQWDKTIINATNGSLYAYSWYLDIVSPGWEALILDDYKAVAPLPVKNFFGKKIIRQPLFSQQLGVFTKELSLISNTDDLFNELIHRVSYYSLNFNKFHHFTKETLSTYQIKTVQRVNYELDLIPSYEYLFKKFNENTRRNIKKAKNEKVILKINELKAETFVNFIRKNLNKKVTNLTVKDYHKIENIVNFAMKANIASIYSVHNYSGEILSSVCFIYSHRRVYYLFAASCKKAKEQRTMFLLLDEFIKQHSEKNLILDFEGSMLPGLARFYAGFGALPTHFYTLTYNKLPFYLRWFNN